MITNLLLALSWIFLIFGVIGIYRLSNLYAKLLTSSKIDTVATLTIIIALIFHQESDVSAFKLILLLTFIMLTNPVTNHFIAKLAHEKGYHDRHDH